MSRYQDVFEMAGRTPTGGVSHAARELGVRGDVAFISGDAGFKNIVTLLSHAPAPEGA